MYGAAFGVTLVVQIFTAWAFDPIIKTVNTLESIFVTLMHGRNKSGHNWKQKHKPYQQNRENIKSYLLSK
jgi:uncharacterized protein (UPF0128 family)